MWTLFQYDGKMWKKSYTGDETTTWTRFDSAEHKRVPARLLDPNGKIVKETK